MLAWLAYSGTAAVDYIDKREGLLMAPLYTVPAMLARDGLALQDFDFYEIHEAFAAQVLCTLAAWQDEEYCRETLGLAAPFGSIDRARLNVNGSSLAKILAQAPTRAGGRPARGLVSICAAGRQGVVAILEQNTHISPGR